MQRFLALLLLAVPFIYAQNQPSLAQLEDNDVRVFQYALLLERLEADFYTRFQAQFTADNFTAAGLTATDYEYFNLIRNHEQAHVALLSSIVPDANTSACTYTYPVTDVRSYLTTAAALENTGVSAYDGAVNRIYNKGFQTAAATIATVEARHASYLNLVNARVPFPNVTDIAVAPADIVSAVFGAGGFANCPLAAGYVLPELLVVQPIANASDSSQPTPQTLASNDLLVLQYALFLEHFEAAFYNDVVARFNSSFSADVATYINLVRQHENAHVTALAGTISSLGGTAAPACNSYNFSSVTNVNQVFSTAALLENTGVYAYNGAISAINDNTLKQVAATIATVEARHASYLNLLSQNAQGPVNGGSNTQTVGAYDNAFNFTTIVNAVVGTGLLGDCSNALPFVQPFQVLVVKPYTNSSTPTSAPTSAPTRSPSTTAAGPTTPATIAPATPTPAATTATTGATTSSTPAPTIRPTTRPVTTTSDATIATVSVAVALLAALAAF